MCQEFDVTVWNLKGYTGLLTCFGGQAFWPIACQSWKAMTSNIITFKLWAAASVQLLAVNNHGYWSDEDCCA